MDLNKLREAILNLTDEATNKTLKESNGLKQLTIDNEQIVYVEIYLASQLNSEEEKRFKEKLIRLVKIDYKFPGIKYKFIPLENKNSILERDIKFILIASGKGGVGKSNVTINLAAAIKRMGKKVGVIDADIYGASIPNILGIDSEEIMADENGNSIPYIYDNMQIISTAFFIGHDKPLMWRGPMLGKMLDHFFTNVLWNSDLEYILIDLPPGTGDVAIDLGKKVTSGKMFVVTTPHKDAANIAIKAGIGARNMGMDIIGVIENMAYYINPINQEKDYIFGSGGGLMVSNILNVPLFAQIPIGQAKGVIFQSNEAIGEIYDEMAKKIASKWL